MEEDYVQSFNLYKGGTLYQSGLTGNSYGDTDVDGGTEYCYTLTQNMPDDSESGHSPEACATPTELEGSGETCFDPVPLDGELPISATGEGIENFQNDYGLILQLPYGATGGDMVYAYTADSDNTLLVTIAADYDNVIGVFKPTTLSSSLV